MELSCGAGAAPRSSEGRAPAPRARLLPSLDTHSAARAALHSEKNTSLLPSLLSSSPSPASFSSPCPSPIPRPSFVFLSLSRPIPFPPSPAGGEHRKATPSVTEGAFSDPPLSQKGGQKTNCLLISAFGL